MNAADKLYIDCELYMCVLVCVLITFAEFNCIEPLDCYIAHLVRLLSMISKNLCVTGI